jgi:hypothetical protein
MRSLSEVDGCEIQPMNFVLESELMDISAGEVENLAAPYASDKYWK